MISEISYGIIPIREGKILILSCYGAWDFPKGKQEDGEQGLITALRELKEESDLSVIEFPFGYDYAETEPYKKGKKVARYYVARCDWGDVRLLPNPVSGKIEHHSFKWADPQEASELLQDRLKPVLIWALEKIKHAKS